MSDSETPPKRDEVAPSRVTRSGSGSPVKPKLAEIASDWADHEDEPAEAVESSPDPPAGEPPSEEDPATERVNPAPERVNPAPERSPTAPVSTRKAKKESFKWNTPADEFADDVGSDEEGEYLVEGDEAAQHAADIVIHLGQDADKFELERKFQIKGETPEDIQRFLDHYNASLKTKDSQCSQKKSVSKQKYECPKCNKVWNWPWELRRHVLTHYKEKEREQTTAFKCEECGRGFQWKRDLAQHRRLHTGEKLLVCSVCEKKFTTRQALLHHVVVHTGEKPFQCALCGNRFTQPANLRTHMKKKHGGGGIDSNKCPHCHEQFPSIIAIHQHILEDHQNIVAEEREEQEMEKLKREQEKAEKLRAREERRKVRADRKKEKIDYNDFKSKGLHEWEINYEFYIGEGLVKGVDWDRTPSNGELSCEICERKFGWRYEVMFHNLCHMVDEMGNTKNKVCPECDTSFKVPIGLKHHLLLHTGELPFLCLHCWRSFSSHIDLKLHIRKEHLFHLEPEKKTPPPQPKKLTKIKAEPKKMLLAAKKQKMEGLDEGENHELNNHESMQIMVASQDGDEGEEGQTILLGSDGTIVHTGNQDMIVVIQSEDFDQSNGLIVVDPSQLQQVVGSDGMPVTVLQTQDGMIFGHEDGKVIVSEAGSSHHGGESSMALEVGDENGHTTYAVQGPDGKFFLPDGTQVEAANISINGEDSQILVSEHESNNESAVSEEETRIIVSDAAPTSNPNEESMITSDMNNESSEGRQITEGIATGEDPIEQDIVEETGTSSMDSKSGIAIEGDVVVQVDKKPEVDNVGESMETDEANQ